MATGNLHPVGNWTKASPVVNIQCICHTFDEIKKYKIRVFLYMMRTCFCDGNDDDNDDYSENDDDVKNMFLYTWFLREL